MDFLNDEFIAFDELDKHGTIWRHDVTA